MGEKDIKVILFDLGNVIIRLDEEASFREMARHGHTGISELKELLSNASFFHQFERGEINETRFRQQISDLLQNNQISEEQIDTAWNKMLIKIAPEVIETVIKLREQKQIMVLSNTNSIHEKAFHRMLQAVTNYSNLNQIFDKVYLSHEIGRRKPDPESWQYILDNNNKLKPEDILFLDDKLENINAANQMGIRVKQITTPDETLAFIEEVFLD